MGSSRFLVVNGVPCLTQDTPSISTFLQSHSGAYTTSRTNFNASSLLFWERHLLRLADSTRVLAESCPDLFISQRTRTTLLSSSSSSCWDFVLRPLVTDSLRAGFRSVLIEQQDGGRSDGEELAVTTLICGNGGPPMGLDVYVHFGIYVPPVFGGTENSAHLAVVGCGRDVARAKWSEWVRTRKCLEKLRPPLATELLLSNDGDRILEGSITNFFVVCHREMDSATGDPYDCKSRHSFEVQTAPISDGILPGVVRQLVIEICSSKGIPFREVAPSWSSRKSWKEAFITNSLRLVQHVETILVPNSWKHLQSKMWNEVSWEEKKFEGPGLITTEIQKQIMERAGIEGYPLSHFL
ncbi:uncharacterized protein LOC131253250 isoform X3 [Magnolia sinica]|uniref:uncharacterized protein LOC131253250 isoform X3 n=2 Tax=Magnolia sinica TaxID=86752 RepID=UPI00265ABABB|nr:uncharacterized protein LOC131253250 isoform X3 [Magnolia sinica]